MEPLTRRQQDILHYIGDVAGSRDRAPTLAEIAAAFGMSPPGAFKHVRALARKGCLVVSPGLHRGIRLKGGRRRWKVQGALRGDFDRRIGAKLAGETDLRRIFDVVAGDVRTWLDVERAELLVHDPAHRMLRGRAFYSPQSEMDAEMNSCGRGLPAPTRVAQNSPEEITRSRPDLSAEAPGAGAEAEGRSHNSSSSISDPGAGLAAGALRRRKPAVAGGLAAVPVPASGRVAGVLVLTDRRAGRAFDETRLARAAMAAAALGPALEQAALGEELRRRIRLQAALAALCRTVNAVRDFQTVAREVHAIVRGLVDADYFEITVHDSDRWWVLLESDTVDGVTKANDVPHVVDPVDNPGLRAIRTRPYYILHRTPAEIARLEGAGRAASADGWNPVGHVGLSEIAERHVAPSKRRELGAQLFLDLRVTNHRCTQELRDRIAREVVPGRAEPARHQHRVGAIQRETEHVHDPRQVVANNLVVEDVDPDPGQAFGHPSSVRVRDLAEEQLGPDAHDLGSHAHADGVAPSSGPKLNGRLLQGWPGVPGMP